MPLLNGTLYILYFVPGDLTNPAMLSALARPWPYSVSLLSSTPTLNAQSLRCIVSFSSMFWERNSEWMVGTVPVVCCDTEATKYAGFAVPQAAAGQFSELPGMVMSPQPFDVWKRSSESS